MVLTLRESKGPAVTSDIEWLRSLDVPVSILAERAGRSETAISFELKELEDNGNNRRGSDPFSEWHD